MFLRNIGCFFFFQRTTWHYVAEGVTVHNHGCERTLNSTRITFNLCLQYLMGNIYGMLFFLVLFPLFFISVFCMIPSTHLNSLCTPHHDGWLNFRKQTEG
jgi:hypothetical protein